MRLSDMPLEFGMDSKQEYRAWNVQRTLQELEARLAREFSMYLAIACGGELRHIASKGLNETTTNKCLHLEFGALCWDKGCCAHICEVWSCGQTSPPALCGCQCKHRHTPTVCKFGFEGCSLTACCEHICTEESGCTVKHGPYEPTDRVKQYLKSMTHSMNRAYGWDQWWALAKDDLAAWMRECAEAFYHPCWGGGGYGGPKWGTAAELTADWLEGAISTRLYLDRCWSLQHNGGCIFNKFYTLDIGIYDGVYALMEVLDWQAKNSYDELSVYHASEYVARLWWEHAEAQGVKEYTEIRELAEKRRAAQRYHKAIGSPLVEEWGNDQGCACCAWSQAAYKSDDPCGAGTSSCNEDCAYYKDHGAAGGHYDSDDEEDDDGPDYDV
jgi:hypothetical protein